MAEFNKGDIAEAILVAAVAARFKKRFRESDFAAQKRPMAVNVRNLKPINIADVQEVLSAIVSGSVQYRISDFDKKTRKEVNIFDNINVSVSIPTASMNFLSQRKNWASVSNIFNSAVAKVNQDAKLRSSALSLAVNLKEDTISVKGVGTENQKGTKADILVEIRRNGKSAKGYPDKKISLKYDAPQFAQAVGLEFENFGKIFDPLGLNDYLNFNAMFESEVMMPFPDILSKRFDSRESITSSREVEALKKVAKEVFRVITIQLAHKLDSVAFKEQLARYCIEKATSKEKIELVKFTPSGGQYTQQFGQSFIDNVKATDFDVTYDSAGSDPKIIIHEKGKGTGSAYKLIQFRYRTDASSSNKAGQKKIVMRSYVESGDLLYKL